LFYKIYENDSDEDDFNENRKSLTRGRTEQFSNILADPKITQLLLLFASCDREL